MNLLKSFQVLTILLSLSACSSHSSQKSKFVIPFPPVYDEVEVTECKKDQICASDTSFCLTEDNFKKMISNTLKDRAYQEQLLNILEALRGH